MSYKVESCKEFVRELQGEVESKFVRRIVRCLIELRAVMVC